MPKVAKKALLPCDPVLCIAHQGTNFVCWCGRDGLARVLHNRLCDLLNSENPTLEQIHEIDEKVKDEWGSLYSIRKGYSGYIGTLAYWRKDCGRLLGLNQAIIGSNKHNSYYLCKIKVIHTQKWDLRARQVPASRVKLTKQLGSTWCMMSSTSETCTIMSWAQLHHHGNTENTFSGNLSLFVTIFILPSPL